MPGINTKVISHHLKTDPTCWSKKQKRWSLTTECQEAIAEEAKVARQNFNLNSASLCMHYQWCNNAFYGNKTCRDTSLRWAPKFFKNCFLLLLKILNHNDGQLTWGITYQTLRRPSRVYATGTSSPSAHNASCMKTRSVRCCRHKIAAGT